MFYLIGIGIGNEKGITLEGLEILKGADSIYLENYTSKLNFRIEDLEALCGKQIIEAERDFVEQKFHSVLNEAKDKEIALLVSGDPLSATTHLSLILQANELGVMVKVIHNASIITAVGETGLEVYKFGKITSIPFPQESFMPQVFYDVLKQNLINDMHTLLLLDMKPSENKFMAIKEAIEILLAIESKRNENVFKESTICIGCARLGLGSKKIACGSAEELMRNADFGDPPYCLIVPASLHFMEEEFLQLVKSHPSKIGGF